MSCDAQQFGGITREKFNALVEQVKNELGITITGDSGEAKQAGFTIAWSYRESTADLFLQCNGKPFIVPCGVVNAKIKALVDAVNA